MADTEKDKAMKLAVVDPNYTNHWIEIHKAGCRDLRKDKPAQYTLSAETRADAAKEVGADFIREGSMTFESVLSQVYFAPCLRLFN